jgi:hypothetical protein
MSAGAAVHFWEQGYSNVRVVVGGTWMLVKAGLEMLYRKN